MDGASGEWLRDGRIGVFLFAAGSSKIDFGAGFAYQGQQ